MRRIDVHTRDLIDLFKRVRPRTRKPKILNSTEMIFFCRGEYLHYSLSPDIKIKLLNRVQTEEQFTLKFYKLYTIIKTMENKSILSIKIYKKYIVINESIKFDHSLD